jgi:hypothetical protein
MLQDDEIQDKLPKELPQLEPAPRPAKVKKQRKKRGPNKPKVKPVDNRPVEISDDDPALQTAPNPKIDAQAAAQQVILARAETEAQEAMDKLAAARKLIADTDANTAPKNVQIREVGMKLSDLQARLDESRNRPKPVYVAPPPTERQQTKIDEEMAAGQRRVAHFAAIEKARVQLAPDPNEPLNTPVYRPADFVPDINSKDPAIGSQNLK